MTTSTITAGDGATGMVHTGAIGNDGSLIIQTGAAGAKVNAITYAADGTPTLLKPLIILGLPSMVKSTVANGYSATNTAVRVFTNITNGVNGAIVQGADITVVSSASLGTTYTINTAGIYAMSYYDQFAAVSTFGITINSVNLSTPVYSLPFSEVASMSTSSQGNNLISCGATMYLTAGTVVRAHGVPSAGVGTTGSGTSNFIITKVG